MNNYIDSHAKCPYYLRHGRSEWVYSITCEPIMSPKRLGFKPVQRTGFARQQDFQDYVELFCCDRYFECPVYKAIYQNRTEEEQNVGTKKKRRKV